MSNEVTYPTELIDLCSQGYFYPESSPLSSGKIELAFPAAKHEDILMSQSLIRSGVVLDKFLEALIVDKSIKTENLLVADKTGLLMAARIMAYGKEYSVIVKCPACDAKSTQTIDLELIEPKITDFSAHERYKNEFEYQLPFSKRVLTFRLLTGKDETECQVEIEALKKTNKTGQTTEVTTRMKKSVLAVDGDRDRATVNGFITNMPTRDSALFREHAREVNPDLDLSFDFVCPDCGHASKLEIPIDVNFFWPNA